MKIHLYKSKRKIKQPYHSTIVARNGKVVFTSENYKTKQMMVKTAESVSEDMYINESEIVDHTKK